VPDPEDRWDRASTYTSWRVEGVELSDSDKYQAMQVDFPVKIGDKVWALYAVYSTGDSFGHDDGRNLELISFHKKESVARSNYETLIKRKPGDVKFSAKIKTDSGKQIDFYVPWDGYFESLDYLELESFKVEKSE
jgi:hypothetical protein